MKDWVKPHLLKKITERVNRTKEPQEEKRQLIELKAEELEEPGSVFVSLVDFFQCEFGVGGFQAIPFMEIFESVLADLPEAVFKKLSEMKNVFFIRTPFPGAEVKILRPETDIKKGQILRIVNFPFETRSIPRDVLRGHISHELAHVFLEHDYLKNKDHDQTEDEADQTAISWGFEKEIEASTLYFKKLEAEFINKL